MRLPLREIYPMRLFWSTRRTPQLLLAVKIVDVPIGTSVNLCEPEPGARARHFFQRFMLLFNEVAMLWFEMLQACHKYISCMRHMFLCRTNVVLLKINVDETVIPRTARLVALSLKIP